MRTKLFNVNVVIDNGYEWETHKIIVQADNEEQAVAKAHKSFEDKIKFECYVLKDKTGCMEIEFDEHDCYYVQFSRAYII